MMDLSTTTQADSTQINADDLIGTSQTYTISSVSAGNPEQPVNIHLAETDRAYRPSKSMRRVLVNAWGKDSSAYVGRRLTLYRDPAVRFGKDVTGGIKVSHLSHIDKRVTLSLTVSRGKKAPHTVDPLPTDAPAAAPEPTAEQVAECIDETELTAMWRRSGPERQAQIQERVAELRATQDGDQS